MMQFGVARKPARLCVVPPFSTLGPPAGIAYLLGYAAAQGYDDIGFLDLRLGIPEAYAPTYVHTGIFGEAYVMDIPDLPLVLSLLRAHDNGDEPLAHVADVLDAYCIERGITSAYLLQYLTTLNDYLREVAQQLDGTRFIGFSVWTSNYMTSLLFAAHLKRLSDPPTIVAGGPQLTESRASAALALRSGLLDGVVVGEGESALLEAYRLTREHGGLRGQSLPGGATLASDGTVEYGPKRPLLKPDDIALPAFDQMPLLAYQQAGLRTVPYHLSRGCTNKCTFCSEWTFWERFRPGDSNQTVAGIQELKRRYGAEYIEFTDSLVNGHQGRLRSFVEGMIRQRVGVSWGGFMRADVDEEMAKQMKRSGCNVVFVGVESMSDETLALMNKKRTSLQNVNAVRALLDAGIRVVAGFIPGFPGDERSAFMDTAHQLRSLQQRYRGALRVNVEPFIVSPGQPLFVNLKDIGLTGVPWNDEVLDIAPRYKDVTSGIFCRVDGVNQGIERVGRLRIAEALESDEPTRSDVFDYKGSEYLTQSRFDIEHITGSWFIARLKGPMAWIYAVIVSERERDELQDEVFEGEWEDILATPRIAKILRRIERTHLIKPRRAPHLVDGGYVHAQAPGDSYRLSPYVIARQGDWRVKNRLIVTDFVTLTDRLLPPWQASVITALQQRSHTVESLRRAVDASALSRQGAADLLHDLTEHGITLAVQATVAAPRTETMAVPISA
ncbi:MAG: hypothetical protein JWM87_4269 [Candidatus Eremiobacteraeota bacterium]|nr:hypothetical protein [Candidatus Eremiobacteraeota bacterium]